MLLLFLHQFVFILLKFLFSVFANGYFSNFFKQNWELMNTAVLTGRQVSQAMKVFIVSQAGKIADVTLQSSCYADDESVIKVSRLRKMHFHHLFCTHFSSSPRLINFLRKIVRILRKGKLQNLLRNE